MEHQDIDIVAVNDPFIEPHYAVSSPDDDRMLPRNFVQVPRNGEYG